MERKEGNQWMIRTLTKFVTVSIVFVCLFKDKYVARIITKMFITP